MVLSANVGWFSRIGGEVADMLELSPLGGGAGPRRLSALSQVPGETYAERQPRVHRLARALPRRALLLLRLELRLWLSSEKGGPGIFELTCAKQNYIIGKNSISKKNLLE
jgi:hypothetical protein